MLVKPCVAFNLTTVDFFFFLIVICKKTFAKRRWESREKKG